MATTTRTFKVLSELENIDLHEEQILDELLRLGTELAAERRSAAAAAAKPRAKGNGTPPPQAPPATFEELVTSILEQDVHAAQLRAMLRDQLASREPETAATAARAARASARCS